jgi:hypothetical protein
MFALSFMLACIFPIFDSGPGDFVGLSIANTNNQAQYYSVIAFGEDGRIAAVESSQWDPGVQRAFLLPDFFTFPPVLPLKSLRISPIQGPTANGCNAVLSQGNDEKLVGVEPATAGGTTVYLPHISVATGFLELEYTDTRLAIVNTQQDVANVTAQLFGVAGEFRGSTSFSLPALGSHSFLVSQAFANAIFDNAAGGKQFEGYIRLDSNVAVAAWERIETPLSWSALRGRAAEEIQSTTLALAPHFAVGGEYSSVLNLMNPTGAPLSLELTAVDNNGRSIGTPINVTLAPGQLRRSMMAEFLAAVTTISPQPLISGYIRIRNLQGDAFQIVGDLEISVANRGATRAASMLYPISDAPAQSWTVPFAVSDGGYFTGYAIANPNELLAAQTDVQVDIIGPAGNVLSTRSISLSPRSRESALIPPGVTSGYLRFTSNLPIHVMSSIGTVDGRALDSLPALRN